ncbi:hypothetical protein X975_22919, partial [Stegodyphus mimosarum]
MPLEKLWNHFLFYEILTWLAHLEMQAAFCPQIPE